jgi:hypothetical protein
MYSSGVHFRSSPMRTSNGPCECFSVVLLSPYHRGADLFLGVALFRCLDFQLPACDDDRENQGNRKLFPFVHRGSPRTTAYCPRWNTLSVYNWEDIFGVKPLRNRIGRPFGLTQKRSLFRLVHDVNTVAKDDQYCPRTAVQTAYFPTVYSAGSVLIIS